jgi:hypothetical protein
VLVLMSRRDVLFAGLGEEPLSAAEQDWENEQPEFVDQVNSALKRARSTLPTQA